jgi:hypothetical protein
MDSKQEETNFISRLKRQGSKMSNNNMVTMGPKKGMNQVTEGNPRLNVGPCLTSHLRVQGLFFKSLSFF